MEHIGKRLGDPALPVPAAVIDRAAVKRNCARMIAAIKAMDLSWRAHIKTHKVRCCLSLFPFSATNTIT